MTRSVRRGCPVSGFPFTMVIVSIFRGLDDDIIPWVSAWDYFMGPCWSWWLCGRCILFPIKICFSSCCPFGQSSEIQIWISIAGIATGIILTMKSTIIFIVDSLEIVWILTRYIIIRVRVNVGIMIDPDDFLHRWIVSRNIFRKVCRRTNKSLKSLIDYLNDYKIYTLFVLRFISVMTSLTRLYVGTSLMLCNASQLVIKRYIYIYTDDQNPTATVYRRGWNSHY